MCTVPRGKSRQKAKVAGGKSTGDKSIWIRVYERQKSTGGKSWYAKVGRRQKSVGGKSKQEAKVKGRQKSSGGKMHWK